MVGEQVWKVATKLGLRFLRILFLRLRSVGCKSGLGGWKFGGSPGSLKFMFNGHRYLYSFISSFRAIEVSHKVSITLWE